MTPGPKNGKIFFGDPWGAKTTKEPVRIDFSLKGVIWGQSVKNKDKLKVYKVFNVFNVFKVFKVLNMFKVFKVSKILKISMCFQCRVPK